MAQKSITQPIPLIWLRITCVSKNKVCHERTEIWDTEGIHKKKKKKKKKDNSTKSHYITGVPK
jgi:hypothetical protein